MKIIIYLVAFFFMIPFLSADTRTDHTDILHHYGQIPQYRGESLKTIAFPIGGIGTGNITLGGRGNIKELEIFNRPAKNKSPDLTFFSIWIQKPDRTSVAKILERQFLPPYTGWMGFPRNQLAGASRFEKAVFRGEYPFASLQLFDAQVPVEIKLETYNPFIPLAVDKSSIPAAIFKWKIKNPLSGRIKGAIVFSMQNPIKTKTKEKKSVFAKNVNTCIQDEQLSGIFMRSNNCTPEATEYGNISILTTESSCDIQTRWYRGGWWDNAHVFWTDFSDDGRIQNTRDSKESINNRSDVCSLLVYFELDPGEEKTIPFYLTWYFPNRENYWNREKEVKGKAFRNFYATRFKSSLDAARYLITNEPELYADTKKFHDLLFASTLPGYVIDAISSQASSIKTNLIMQDQTGKCHGFEGLTDDSGCCMGSCTHVWNYEQTLACLFPSLERSMREIAFFNDTFANGYQTFRTLFPPGNYWWKVKPAADGQMGNIVRVYREWKYSGDTGWLKRIWPKTRAALEFAWKGVGSTTPDLQWQKEKFARPWDADQDGVMEGEQHNTYDIEFYGPNSMVGSLYLAALKAGAEMARAVGDTGRAKQYLKIYKKGRKAYDRLLWNGEYYSHKIQIAPGLQIPERLQSPRLDSCNESCKGKQSPLGKKKALEQGDIMPKYQYGEGCLSDQLLGQYLAYVTGLGHVLPKDHVKKSLQSIFNHNFQRDLSHFSNVQRVYALNDEAGLLLCTWPRGKRPLLPFVYSDEVWTGIEYQVAASLIYAGNVEEGLTIVKAVRDRHRGFNRNPWDEFECGHHYARALASWAVLLAVSGYHYDGVNHSMVFAPKLDMETFKTFWSCGTGWGDYRQTGSGIELICAYGSTKLNRLAVPAIQGGKKIKRCLLNSNPLSTGVKRMSHRNWILFKKTLTLTKDDTLQILF